VTVKEAKEFFRSIRTEQIEIRHLKEMLQETESGMLPQAIRYDKTKVQVYPDETMSRICDKIAEYEQELGESIALLIEKKIKAEQLIRELDDEREREVIRWYYLTVDDGYLLTWGQVAMRMNYNERYVKQLHGNALLHLAKKG
jgi:hypothetical protein